MTLSTGKLNGSDSLTVDLHEPADLPAFILVKWPAAPSVASPDNFDALVGATYRTLSRARITLSRMRGDRRTQ
jgi:hypothetical protein